MTLAVANAVAFVLLVIAFTRELRARTRQTEDGRALLVVLAAWVAVTAAAAWVITRTRA